MIWPFENDTSYITNKIAKRDLVSNKKSNIIIIFTVVLMEIFICSILSIGVSYYKNVEKMQQLLYGKTPEWSSSTPLSIIVLLGIIFFVLIVAYLLMYNVLCFCASKNIRLYGQIKTVGGTKKQLCTIFMRQSGIISNIGIVIGICIFSLVNQGIAPRIIFQLIGNQKVKFSNIEVFFSPAIYLISIILVKLTTRFCYRRIVTVAGELSSAESLKFTGYSGRAAQQINILKWMPYRNVFRNKRMTFITFMSLCIGICLFWVTIELANTLNVDKLSQIYFQNANILIHIDDPSMRSEIDRISLKEISNIQGVDEIRKISYLSVEPKIEVYSSKSFEDYLYRLYNEIPEYKESESDFREGEFWQTELYGIGNQDLKSISEHLSYSIDPIAFEDGKIAIFCMPDLDIDYKAVVFGGAVKIKIGEQEYNFNTLNEGISCRIISDNETVSPHYNAPSIIISNSALEKIANETGGKARTFQIKVLTKPEMESTVLQSIQELTHGSSNLSVQSRLEKEHELRMSFETGKLLLMILSGVLFAIGLINYLNTLSINIAIRNVEFAILESVGMTKKQSLKMLYKESMIYWFVTSLLCIVVGTIMYNISYYIFEKVTPYTQYKYSVGNLCIMLLIMLLSGLLVSKCIYQSQCKKSVTERMKHIE